MEELNFPSFSFKTRLRGQTHYIYDSIRKKYVVLTSEEWVRQNVIKYLVDYLGYPEGLLGVEKQIDVCRTKKRPDIIVYDNSMTVRMIVECKRPQIPISTETLEQAIRYYVGLKSDYFLLTNGKRHYCCQIINNSCQFMNFIPKFTEIAN